MPVQKRAVRIGSKIARFVPIWQYFCPFKISPNGARMRTIIVSRVRNYSGVDSESQEICMLCDKEGKVNGRSVQLMQ